MYIMLCCVYIVLLACHTFGTYMTYMHGIRNDRRVSRVKYELILSMMKTKKYMINPYLIWIAQWPTYNIDIHIIRFLICT